MAEVNVIKVESGRDRRRFLELPWSIYRGDPNWIPPLRMDQEELVGYKNHPFYHANAVQTFLAVRNGEPVGRIAAILNRGHLERYDEKIGFWGFFESIDDQEVADALFDAARKWFAEEHDIHHLRGPMNPSMNYTLGLLIDGFDSSPFFMMTYNPPYYEKLIEDCGFKKIQDLYAYWGHVSMLPKIREKLLPVCERIIEHTGAHVRPMNTRDFRGEIERFLTIYNQSLMNTWGFVPMSDAELKAMAAGLRYLMVPELALAVECDDKVVGAVFGLPDYNPRIRAINGRLFPFGWAKLLWRKQAIKKVRIISTNVLPEYQMQGLGLVLLNGLVPKAMEWGLQEAEFSWVLESNLFSRGSLEKGGAQRTKTYRVYDWKSDA